MTRSPIQTPPPIPTPTRTQIRPENCTRPLARAAVLLLLGAVLTLGACGKKGDPIRPGFEDDRRQTGSD